MDAERSSWNCDGCHGERTAILWRFIAISILFIGRRWCDENGHPRARGRPQQQHKRAKPKEQSARAAFVFSLHALSFIAHVSAPVHIARALFSLYFHAFALTHTDTHWRREICFLGKDWTHSAKKGLSHEWLICNATGRSLQIFA